MQLNVTPRSGTITPPCCVAQLLEQARRAREPVAWHVEAQRATLGADQSGEAVYDAVGEPIREERAAEP